MTILHKYPVEEIQTTTLLDEEPITDIAMITLQYTGLVFTGIPNLVDLLHHLTQFVNN